MKEKEETKAYTVRFKPSLMAKVEAYVGLVKANKEAKEPSLSKTKFFNELLEDFFSNKVLDKEFIELQKPYYVNTKLLMEEKFSYATTEKPSSDLKNQMIIYKVPTNLDKWSNEYKTFCSQKPNCHEGIKPYLALFGTEAGTKLKIIYHIFKLEYWDSEGIKDPSLEVHIIPPEELEIFLNQHEEEVAEKLLHSFELLEMEVNSDLASGLTAEEVFKKYDDPGFFRMLTYEQKMQNAKNIYSKAINTIFESISEAATNLETISEDFEKMKEEKGKENITSSDVFGFEGRIIDNSNPINKGIKKFETGLTDREARAYIGFNNDLEENPDNVVYNALDKITESLEDLSSSGKPVSHEEILKTVTKVAHDINTESIMNPEAISTFLEESDLPEEVKQAFNIMYSSENEEEIPEEMLKLASDVLKK